MRLTQDFVEFIECCVRREVSFGCAPIRIDLLTSITGVTFDDCWSKRVMIGVGGVEAGFISAEDLITNKRAAGRPQDLVDADKLQHEPGRKR